LWAVTAVVWLGIFGYVLYLLRRQGRMKQEIEFIERSIAELEKDASR
jgi:CcmD family protein